MDITAAWPVLGPIIAIILPFLTKYASSGTVKKAIAVTLAIAAGVASVATEPWDAVNMEVLVTRVVLIWGAAEAAYRVVNPLVERIDGQPFGAQPMFRPSSGLGTPVMRLRNQR